MTREELVLKIAEIESSAIYTDAQLVDMIKNGHRGVKSFTDAELVAMHREYTGEDVELFECG